MVLSSTRVGDSVEEVVGAAVTGADDLTLLDPDGEAIRALTDHLQKGQVRLLAAPAPLKRELETFRTAATLADLVAADRLTVRTTESAPRQTLLVSPESVTALVTGSDQAAGLVTGDPSFVADVHDSVDEQWAAATPHSLRTPPLSVVRETLRREVGEAAGADFDRLLETGLLDDGIDEVAGCLLVAARNGDLFYDLSRWGEDVGLASKATFSRTKARLEEADLLGTEKVPIEVGRPRLRLHLPEELAGDPIESVAETAAGRL